MTPQCRFEKPSLIDGMAAIWELLFLLRALRVIISSHFIKAFRGSNG